MPGEPAIEKMNETGLLILYEPDRAVRDAMTRLLHGEGWAVRQVASREEVNRVLGESEVAAVISESILPGDSPFELLDYCRERRVPVIFTGHGLPLQSAVDLIRAGAVDFLDKPFPQQRLLELLRGLGKWQNGPDGTVKSDTSGGQS